MLRSVGSVGSVMLRNHNFPVTTNRQTVVNSDVVIACILVISLESIPSGMLKAQVKLLRINSLQDEFSDFSKKDMTEVVTVITRLAKEEGKFHSGLLSEADTYFSL